MIQKYDYIMFEKEITLGNHVSYHFAYKNKFSTISNSKSLLYPLEKELQNKIKINLSGYTIAITPPNTTWNEDPVFHVGGMGMPIDDMIKDYFYIAPEFSVFYFTKTIKTAISAFQHKCGFRVDGLLELQHPYKDAALEVANFFLEDSNDIIFACYFDEYGNVASNEINIEIMPQYDKWSLIKKKLISFYPDVENKINLYNNMFQFYHPHKFHWHFKVKLKTDGTTIKFYRTLHYNPYL